MTSNCNFACPFCFADASRTTADPGLDHLCSLLERVYETSPECNLQISGGEPTLRSDLPRIIEHARGIGFKFVQLNTNGFLLAKDKNLVSRLAAAGLASVFLQFDGTLDGVHTRLRGRVLCEIKERPSTIAENIKSGWCWCPPLCRASISPRSARFYCMP